MNVIPYGPHALLLRFAEQADAAAFDLSRSLIARLERDPPAGLREIVPAFTTVLLVFEPAAMSAATAQFRDSTWSFSSESGSPAASRLIEIPVHYRGPDLSRVAELAGLAVEDVVHLHATPEYRVHCLGFSPGFPYLGGLDSRLHTARLPSPRPRVPAGSVAIGGEHTGIYSIPSPGGWNLIGSTTESLFDAGAPDVDTMFRLRAGDRVRFTATSSESAASWSEAKAPGPLGLPSMPDPGGVLEIVATGLGLTLQDQGRPGFGRFGVPVGGAMDPVAAAWANRLLDNPLDAPVLELCLQGQRLGVRNDGWVAITGNEGALSATRPKWSAFRVRAGETLEFPPGAHGVWSYLAVPGGFAADRFLGSASSNPRAGIGTSLVTGSTLGVAIHAPFVPPTSTATRRVPWTEIPGFNRDTPLRVWPGPQWDTFTEATREQFFSATWTVSSQCDRVGYRILGPPLLAESAQIISEPVLPGTIQIPAGGQPIVTMPDGPTLGGYPKLGWVDPSDLPSLAQCRPGQTVRFSLVQ
ncbi:MAG TPA: 5-oxoprolinase subunit PxpB [Verrucomicrobiota bacterium]|nr:urea carboxylase [Verrucomicrobiales bacterium]HRI12098.1 5-oxoprolinase subunit PxpB [Verrucomicrobiota bacterium]